MIDEQAILDSILKTFNDRYRGSPETARLLELLENGEATWYSANSYATLLGEHLATAYKLDLGTGAMFKNGKMPATLARRLCTQGLGNNFALTADFCKKVQESLNKEAGIGLSAKSPSINKYRINGIVQRLIEADKYEDISWILDEPVVNYTQSVVDDTIKVNMEVHKRAGYTPQVVRTNVNNCCAWCRSLQGTYSYDQIDFSGDVFRRHERCRCILSFVPTRHKKIEVQTRGHGFSVRDMDPK